MKLSKLVLGKQILPADLVSTKAQKFILGGYSGDSCNDPNNGYACSCGLEDNGCANTVEDCAKKCCEEIYGSTN